MKQHDKPIPHKTTGKGKTYNPTEKGAGMTAKGRAEYNAKNNANLKPPAPNPKTEKDAARKKSFCARMAPIAEKSEKGSRARASMRNWNC
jgi:Domain of unknown function (DUF6321)